MNYPKKQQIFNQIWTVCHKETAISIQNTKLTERKPTIRIIMIIEQENIKDYSWLIAISTNKYDRF